MPNLALKAAFYQKWTVHRRLRPEEFGGRVYNALSGSATYPIHASLMNSNALQTSIQASGSALVSAGIRGGMPAEPVLSRGHAAVAEACATIL